jgi:hypothetical protein
METRCQAPWNFFWSPAPPAKASHVEPDVQGSWWADLAPTGGPKLGPFLRRSDALDAERQWLEDQLDRHQS